MARNETYFEDCGRGTKDEWSTYYGEEFLEHYLIIKIYNNDIKIY